MRVVWVTDAQLRPAAGHGVDFHSDASLSNESLVALVRDFEWLHGDPEVVEVRIRPAGDTYDAETLGCVRAIIESFLTQRGPMNGQVTELSPALYACVNG